MLISISKLTEMQYYLKEILVSKDNYIYTNYKYFLDALNYLDQKGIFCKNIVDSFLVPIFKEFNKNEHLDPNLLNSLKLYNSKVFYSEYSFKQLINLKFDSFMLIDLNNLFQQQRLIDTDIHMIFSSLCATKILVNALDVLHSFTLNSTGIKIDAIVGRVNEMTMFFLRDGIFYGQCSELCGSGHLVCLLLLKL